MKITRLILCAATAGFILVAVPVLADQPTIQDIERQYREKCIVQYQIPSRRLEGEIAIGICVQREFHQAELLQLLKAIHGPRPAEPKD